MDSRLIHQLWSIVDATPKTRLSNLDDSGVLHWLVDLLQDDPAFDARQLPVVSSYIRSRMPLIRELAQQF
ncbi:MAG: hypothetical protein AAFV85_16720 [Cyanobacteria bacterium J06634_6]